ncbi:hypothetical protein D3C76_1541210 [compost metagenome]
MVLGAGKTLVLHQVGEFLGVLGQAWRAAVVAAQCLGVLGADPQQLAFTVAARGGGPQLAGTGQAHAHHHDQEQHTQVGEAVLPRRLTTRNTGCHHAPSLWHRS